MKLEISLDDFYKTNGPITFVDKMCAFLGITTDKMRIVSIVEGSVIINYEVVLDDVTMKSKTLSKMVTPKNNTNGTTDACAGVSTGIASALNSGSLNLGANVSSMGYKCSKPIVNDTSFNATVKESKNSTKN